MEKGRPKFGVLGPNDSKRKDLAGMQGEYDIIELHPKGWDEAEINRVVQECIEKGIDVVGGFSQPDVLHHVLINARLGNVTPSKLSLLYCMNKYLMRTCENDPFWFVHIDPDAETDEEIIAKIKEWPFVLKIASLTLGLYCFKIHCPEELQQRIRECKEDEKVLQGAASQFQKICEGIERNDLPPILPPLIAEHWMDVNRYIEFCYDGYVTIDGKVRHYAMTEEVYYDNHQMIGFLTPPLNYPAKDAHLIEAFVEDYMSKLISRGFRNQFFNIEFWMEPGKQGKFYFVEINPRVSPTAHYSFKASYGSSLLSENIELARNGTEPSIIPWKKWKDGEINCYTMNSLITTQEIGKVGDIVDFSYAKHVEVAENIPVVYSKGKDDLLKESDATMSGASVLEMWITAAEVQDCIDKDIEIREKIYKKSPNAGFPTFWTRNELIGFVCVE